MEQLELKSLAKINLGLDVLGTREDGYHEVRMIMQSVYLYDKILLRKKAEPGIALKSNLSFLPDDDKNIAWKAADLLIREFSLEGGIAIKLEKHIPVAAGLAGGSSNAAAVLFGMNRMYRLGLSTEELMERGVKLGADVPYCIRRGTMLAEGIGEKLTDLAVPPDCTVLLAKPPVNVSTKLVYQALDALEEWKHPDIDGVISGIASGNLEKMAASMGNVLEQVTIPQYPVIEELKQVMKEYGALNAMMSGSGPTVFGLYTEKRQAQKARDQIRSLGLARQVYVAGIQKNRRNKRNGKQFWSED